jgi:hypothetical protein
MMKHLLEAIWNDRKCRAPLHYIVWCLASDSIGGYGYFEGDLIRWRKGKKVQMKRHRR